MSFQTFWWNGITANVIKKSEIAYKWCDIFYETETLSV